MASRTWNCICMFAKCFLAEFHTCHQSAASPFFSERFEKTKRISCGKRKGIFFISSACVSRIVARDQCNVFIEPQAILQHVFFSYPLPNSFSQLACFSPLPDFSAPLTKSFTPAAPAICASFMSSLALLAETVLVKNKLDTLCRNLFWSGSLRVDKSTFLL